MYSVKGPKTTGDGTRVIALPKEVKERLDRLKRPKEPYYRVVQRLLDEYDAKKVRR